MSDFKRFKKVATDTYNRKGRNSFTTKDWEDEDIYDDDEATDYRNPEPVDDSWQYNQ